MSDPKAEEGLAILLASADRKLPRQVTHLLANEAIAHRVYWVVEAGLLVEHAQTLLPDAILVDVRASSSNMLPAVAELARALPRAPVIVLRDEDTALPVGASDSVALPLRGSELAVSVRNAVGRGTMAAAGAASGKAAPAKGEPAASPAPGPADRPANAEAYVYATASRAGQVDVEEAPPGQAAAKSTFGQVLRSRPVKLLAAALVVALLVGAGDLVFRAASDGGRGGEPGAGQTAAANPIANPSSTPVAARPTAEPVSAPTSRSEQNSPAVVALAASTGEGAPVLTAAPASPELRTGSGAAPEAASATAAPATPDSGTGPSASPAAVSTTVTPFNSDPGSQPGNGPAAASPTDVPAPTQQPPTRTPVPPSPTPTVRPTPTPLPTQPPATKAPTNTAVVRQAATATASPAVVPLRPSPTPTTRPAAPVASSTPAPQPTEVALSGLRLSAPAPVAPNSGSQVRGPTRFEWQPTGPLPPGAGYEVVWWNVDENPASARGIAPPVQGTSLTVDVDALYRGNQFRNNQFYWTVLIVRTAPYQRLTQPAESNVQVITYQP